MLILGHIERVHEEKNYKKLQVMLKDVIEYFSIVNMYPGMYPWMVESYNSSTIFGVFYKCGPKVHIALEQFISTK